MIFVSHILFIALTLNSALCALEYDRIIFYQQSPVERMVVASMTKEDGKVVSLDCDVYEKNIYKANIKLQAHWLRRVTEDEMKAILEKCKNKEWALDEERIEKGQKRYIVEGTNWCGSGNKAEHYDDLGEETETDKCCRSHDHCDDSIPGESTKYNITNSWSYTMSHCKCEHEFFDCLHKVNKYVADVIGESYLNFFATDCFGEDYPNTSTCKTYLDPDKRYCKEYEKDTTKPKVIQRITNQEYIGQSTSR